MVVITKLMDHYSLIYLFLIEKVLKLLRVCVESVNTISKHKAKSPETLLIIIIQKTSKLRKANRFLYKEISLFRYFLWAFKVTKPGLMGWIISASKKLSFEVPGNGFRFWNSLSSLHMLKGYIRKYWNETNNFIGIL